MASARPVRRIDGPIEAVVAVPGSKSIANRALVCAALARGTSTIEGVPDGDDSAAMLACLRALGVDAVSDGGRATVSSDGPPWRTAADAAVHAGLAGTTSRFVTAIAALGAAPITIDGHPPLRRRPFGPLHDALVQLGVDVAPGETFGQLPATICGPPSAGAASLPGDVSSQFVSALMMIGPLLPGGLDLRLTTPLVSRPYVELTAAVMGWFGIDAVEITDDRITVAHRRYEPARVDIEPDASSASYPFALAALVGGTVTVDGLGEGSLQGDARFADLLAAMSCEVTRTETSTSVTGSGRLDGIDVDMSDVSDLVPTLAVVAACADTPSRITGVGFIREKESDRIGDLAGELRRAGVEVSETDDGLEIFPSRSHLHGARLATHHDHRLAMAFGVLGSVVDGVVVEDPDVVAKSWPGFWDALDDLRS